MYIEQVPKHVAKQLLPGLKVGALVQTTRADYSEDSKTFTRKHLPAGSVGRVKKIYDFGPTNRDGSRFYCEIKFEGHPITSFYSEELVKVKV